MATKSYHFDVGNSTVGPLGLCARVRADSKQEACELLRNALDEGELALRLGDEDAPGIEYITVFFNPSKIALAANIDEEEEAP